MYPDELVIISVHSAKFPSEKETTNIREAVMRHGIEHPVINDADFKVWQQYAIRAWPTLVLINPEGKVVDTQSGEILASEYAEKVEALISEAEAKGMLDRSPVDYSPERMAEPTRPLNYPSKLLMGADDLLYIADTGHHRLLEVQLSDDGLSGEIVRVFGTGEAGFTDGPPDVAQFHDPHGMTIDAGKLYVADTENHAIRLIELESGHVRTVAGTGEKAHGRFNLGKPTEVPLRSPWALWAQDGIVFIAMAGSHQIWALANDERLGVFAGNGREALVDGDLVQSSFNQPSDLDVGFNHMFVADSEASAIRAISMGDPPRVMTLVGQGLFEFGDIDGKGGMVRLQHPVGLHFADGLVYIADSYNHKIKTLDPTGQTLHTLMLTGLDQLAAMPVSEATRLEPVTVGTGEVEITLDIKLPEGYKLNPETPQLVTVDGDLYFFAETETPRFTVSVEGDKDLTLELTIYYCETDDQRLCLVHHKKALLPLEIEQAAQPSATVAYEIHLPE